MKKQNITPATSEKTQKGKGWVIVAIILGLFIFSGVFLTKTIKAFFNPLEIVQTFNDVTGDKLKQEDGRTNTLILGLDKRSFGEQSGILTDTLIVASVNKSGDTVLISLPRDLWVQSSKGFYEKINAMYYYGLVDKVGTDYTTKSVENVLGIPIHYYVVVDFNLFTEAIDTLGGIEVDVERSFEDYEYPVEGNEASTCNRSEEEIKKFEEEEVSPVIAFPCRYEHLYFRQGPQLMDGKTALKYARSRHGNNGEGNDFARAKRQQKVMLAVKDKGLSLETLINPAKIKDLYDTYSKNVDTNITLGDAQKFLTLGQKTDFSSIKSVVLDTDEQADNGGLLYSPTDTSLYGGRYVLIPRSGDYGQIHAYVQKFLFEQE